MSRYLKKDQHQAVKDLRADGWLMKDIAKKFEICEATVSKILRGNTKPRYALEKIRRVEPEKEQEYLDFSTLPNEILFEHVKEYDFIG